MDNGEFEIIEDGTIDNNKNKSKKGIVIGILLVLLIIIGMVIYYLYYMGIIFNNKEKSFIDKTILSDNIPSEIYGKQYFTENKIYNEDGSVAKDFSNYNIEHCYEYESVLCDVDNDKYYYIGVENNQSKVIEYDNINDIEFIYVENEPNDSMGGITSDSFGYIVSSDNDQDAGIYRLDGRKISNYSKIYDGSTKLSIGQVYYFSYDNITVIDNGKYGVIDLDGKEIIKPKYEFLEQIASDKFIAKLNGKMGIINLDEKILLPFDNDIIISEFNYYILIRDNKMAVMKNDYTFLTDFDMDYSNAWSYDYAPCCLHFNPVEIYKAADYLIIENYNKDYNMNDNSEAMYIYVVDKNGIIKRFEGSEIPNNNGMFKINDNYTIEIDGKCYDYYDNEVNYCSKAEEDTNKQNDESSKKKYNNIKHINGYEIKYTKYSNESGFEIYKDENKIYESSENFIDMNEYYLLTSKHLYKINN